MAVLETWMDLARYDDAKLAAELRVSRVHASRLRRRKCLPSPEVAKRLQNITKIPAERFIFEERAV